MYKRKKIGHTKIEQCAVMAIEQMWIYKKDFRARTALFYLTI